MFHLDHVHILEDFDSDLVAIFSTLPFSFLEETRLV